MQAIILAGGLGSRLRSVLPDLPKPMAPIQDKPFLAHLLCYLKTQGITQVIFSVHHMAKKIMDYFQGEYAGIAIQYVSEEQPLGTGGAIVNTLKACNPGHQPIFVLNGDTFVKLDFKAMVAQHEHSGARMTMALRIVSDCSRYGRVILGCSSPLPQCPELVEGSLGERAGERGFKNIIEFREKGEQGAGLINAGVYLIQPNLFARYSLPSHFSFEQDFIIPYLADIAPQAFMANDYFIDIGIPEDYERAINSMLLECCE